MVLKQTSSLKMLVEKISDKYCNFMQMSGKTHAPFHSYGPHGMTQQPKNVTGNFL